MERANGTLQDRLVKELRLAGVSDIAAANAFAEQYRHVHNEKFAVTPRSSADAHRPVAVHEALDHAFCVKSERVVSRALSVQYDKVRFNLEPSAYARRIAGRTVTICDYPDGRLMIEHGAVALPYTRFDTLQRVGRPEIVEHKRLGGALAWIAEQQAERDREHAPARSGNALKRRGQTGHGFAAPKPQEPTPGKAALARARDAMKRTQAKPKRAAAEPDWEHHIPGETRPAPDVRILNRGTVVARKVSRMLTVNHRGMRYRLIDAAPETLLGEKILLCELEDGHVELFHGSRPLAWRRKRAYETRGEEDGRALVYSKVGDLS